MKESAFQKELVKWLRQRNAYVLNTSGTSYGASGIADLNIVHSRLPGQQCWLELKVGTNSLTPLQKIFLNEMRSRGVDAYCLRLMLTTARLHAGLTLTLEDWSRMPNHKGVQRTRIVQWDAATLLDAPSTPAMLGLFSKMWLFLTEAKRDGLRSL